MATDSKSWDIHQRVDPGSIWGTERPDPIWFHESAPAGGPRKIGAGEAKPDLINAPPHYCNGPAKCECGRPIQPIELARHMSFDLGCVLKYICRAGKKGDAITDLRKAQKYLDDEICRLVDETTPKCVY